jgi:hypothetical protein
MNGYHLIIHKGRLPVSPRHSERAPGLVGFASTVSVFPASAGGGEKEPLAEDLL